MENWGGRKVKTKTHRNKSLNSWFQSPLHSNLHLLQFLVGNLSFHPQQVTLRPQHLRLKPPLLLRRCISDANDLSLLHSLTPPLPTIHRNNRKAVLQKRPFLVEQRLELPSPIETGTGFCRYTLGRPAPRPRPPRKVENPGSRRRRLRVLPFGPSCSSHCRQWWHRNVMKWT